MIAQPWFKRFAGQLTQSTGSGVMTQRKRAAKWISRPRQCTVCGRPLGRSATYFQILSPITKSSTLKHPGALLICSCALTPWLFSSAPAQVCVHSLPDFHQKTGWTKPAFSDDVHRSVFKGRSKPHLAYGRFYLCDAVWYLRACHHLLVCSICPTLTHGWESCCISKYLHRCSNSIRVQYVFSACWHCGRVGKQMYLSRLQHMCWAGGWLWELPYCSALVHFLTFF